MGNLEVERIDLIEQNCKKISNRAILIQTFLIIVLFTVLIVSVSSPVKQSSNFCVKSSENGSNIFLFSNQPSNSPITESEIVRKREFIREMAREAWNAYHRFAWGHEALSPVSKRVYFGKFGNDSGLTIVNSMSTLWTMGLMDEFEEGKRWIESKLDLSLIKCKVLVFEAVTYYVGGLLSCYALTGDVMFRDKAKQIALILEPAFSTASGIPYGLVIPNKLGTAEKAVSAGFISSLSEIAGFQVDFLYLSDATSDARFRNQIYNIRSTLNENVIQKNTKHLYFSYMFPDGKWAGTKVTLSNDTKEGYANLVKSFIQSNLKNVQSIEMYKAAMDAVESVKLFDISRTGLYYVRKYYYYSQIYENQMEHSACQLGAMLSMGANVMQRVLASNKTIGPNERREELYRIYRHSMLAERLTETCHQTSIRTRTGLGPKSFFFNATHDATTSGGSYSLSPELAESYFILWRLTRDVKYRDYAWEMAQAIHRHCRIDGNGYSSIDDVDQIPTSKSNYQPPNFLSATLKYLYLIFSDDTLLPLDQWIFNAQGHPLPICGKNPAYPEDK